MKIIISTRYVLVFFLVILCNAAGAQEVADSELKINVSPIEEPLKTLETLQPRSFEYNTGQYSHLKLPRGKQFGFVAEEVQAVFPQLVTEKQYSYMQGKNLFKRTTTKTVDMQGMVPVLVASVKELQAEVEALKKEIEMLKKQVR